MNLTRITAVAALVALAAYRMMMPASAYNPIENRTVLLVIAHPDDEAMFFAPTLLGLLAPSAHNDVHVLCLSTGNADGMGNTRREELTASCVILGLDSEHVYIIDHPCVCTHGAAKDRYLQDGEEWPWEVVRKVIVEAITRMSIDAVVTFDQEGVSAHPNHIAVSRAADGTADVYTLVSYPLHQKYNPLFTSRYGGMHYRSGVQGWRRAQRAMTQGHKSQMRWFRWGWIICSRYMLTNDYR